MAAIITLTTDFGLGSPYVAQMKGVILSLCPDVTIIDITHGIGPQNIREGAVVLADTTPRFPPETIHVAVIDPGVGTGRELVYAAIAGQRYLAPDNGLLSLLAEQNKPARIIRLRETSYWLPHVSRTFHGRDILSPVVARLAGGLDPAQLGPAQEGLVMLPWPQAERRGGELHGEVLYVDSFGNLITNITLANLRNAGDPTTHMVRIKDCEIPSIAAAYGDAADGQLLALLDSQGRLEIAAANASAAKVLGAAVGEPVIITSSS